jgi:carboxyl-terminal processing protease
MRYYTPSGRAIQARGVQPDVLVRYEADTKSGLPVMREGDLDGALEQEAGAPIEAPPSEVVTGAKRPEIQTLDDVPDDPSGTEDVALLAALRRLALARSPR